MRREGRATSSATISRTREPAALGTATARLLPASARDEAGAIWLELEARQGAGALTCSWVWTETWVRHYGDRVPHWFAIAEMEDEAVGAALITRGVSRKAGLPIRTLHFGTAGEPEDETVYVEFNRLLAPPDQRVTVAASIVRAIRTAKLGFDEWRLDGFVPADAHALAAAIPGLGPRVEACRLVDLRALRDAGRTPLKAFSRNTIEKIGKNLRRFERDLGPISVQWAETTTQAHAIMAELADLHQARWTKAGKPGVFASKRFAQFHRDLIERLLPDRIMLLRVAAGDHTIGCLYGFIESGTLLSYQWGLAEFDNKRVAPGFVAAALAMQAALDRGLDEWNWLSGDMLYKRELSTGERPMVWASARASLRALAVNGLVRLRDAVQSRG